MQYYVITIPYPTLRLTSPTHFKIEHTVLPTLHASSIIQSVASCTQLARVPSPVPCS